MPPIQTPEQTARHSLAEHQVANEALLKRVTERFDQADKGVHKRFRDKADHFYALYRNYTDFRSGHGSKRDARDRDLSIQYAKREWGAELFIPHSFAAVESILPRMLANSPKVIVKPRQQAYEQNAPHMKCVIDGQFAAIDYELRLQKIIRNALTYGLGVQKTYWATRKRDGRALQPSMLDDNKWVAVPQAKTLMDDPLIEVVDPYDWFWDPFAGEVQECEWVIHRTWRSLDYVSKMLKNQYWSGPRLEDVEMGTGGGNAYKETWDSRNRADGTPTSGRSPAVHEVWEYHDGEKVVTVLDRQWVVQNADNPAWHGELPFQVYRPTSVSGHMVGIGEIEPIVDLQSEINTLRSQRRDNATIALNRGFFYSDGMIDPGDFKTGPGIGVPVLGDPREAIFPMPMADIPNSGYQEETALLSDIQRAIGLNDEATAGGQDQTATGAQLIHAQMSLRIKLKTRNAELELVRAAGRQVLALNQQKILTQREVRMPALPTPQEPDRRWSWQKIGPAELQGEFELDVEGGTLAPENVPQQRSDAQMWLGLSQNPQINPTNALKMAVSNLGVEDPEAFIVQPPPEPTVPQAVMNNVLSILVDGAGVDEATVKQAVAQAQAAAAPKK